MSSGSRRAYLAECWLLCGSFNNIFSSGLFFIYSKQWIGQKVCKNVEVANLGLSVNIIPQTVWQSVKTLITITW